MCLKFSLDEFDRAKTDLQRSHNHIQVPWSSETFGWVLSQASVTMLWLIYDIPFMNSDFLVDVSTEGRTHSLTFN